MKVIPTSFFGKIRVGILVLVLAYAYVSLMLIQRVGSEVMRTSAGVTDFAIVHFSNPAGREIIFVAMQHIALASFYDNIETQVAKFPTYTILEEGVEDDMVSESIEVVPEGVRAVTTKLEQYERKTAQVAEERSEVQQPSFYGGGKYLIRDAKLSDLVARCAEEWGCRTWVTKPYLQPYIIPLAFESYKTVFIDERNSIVVKHLFDADNNENTIIIWGASHYDGIAHELKKRGFVETHRTWHTATRNR